MRDFVYLDTQQYSSLDKIKGTYWAMLAVSLISVVAGFASKAIIPILLAVLYNILYWIFIALLQSKYVKKTFELRFLTNGVFGILTFIPFALLFVSISLYSSDASSLGIPFVCWFLISYILYIAVYSVLIVIGVHKGVYSTIAAKKQSPRFLFVSSVASCILPIAGGLGMYVSRIMRKSASEDTSMIIGVIAFVFFFFLTGLSHINFVQYYYCKKYGINCDEHGNTTSPKLERGPSKSEIRKERKHALREYEMTAGEYRDVLTKGTGGGTLEAEKSGTEAQAGGKQSKKRMPLVLKILIGIVSVPILAFVVAFVVALVKAIMEDLS